MTDDVPIRRIREVEVFATRWVRVFDDEVEIHGAPGRYTRVAGGTPGAGCSAVVAARDAEGRFLFIECYRYPMGAWCLELPRGAGEPGASALETAARELTEETGLVAAHLVQVGSVAPGTGLLAEQVAIVLATGLSGTLMLQTSEFIRAARWMSPREALRLATAGALTDAFSLSALLLVLGGPGLVGAP